MKNKETNPEENVIDLGTNTVFKVTYKTIRCANGKTYQIAQKEQVEPELPPRKMPKKKGPGRPKKVVEKTSMEDNTKLDMDSLMEKAKDQVDK